MPGPEFTPEENELLVWLSYTTPRNESGPLDANTVVSYVKNIAYEDREGEAYLLLLESTPEKYPNLTKFKMHNCDVGKETGFQGVSMSDDAGNSIILYEGSDKPSVQSKDWQGNAKTLRSGEHQQQKEAEEFYRANAAKNGAWTYVVGHSLGGGLTLALLVELLGEGRGKDTYGYIENSADFNYTSLVGLAGWLGLDPESAEFRQLKQKLIDSGRLRVASSGEDILSSNSDTQGTRLEKGHWKDFGHNRDRSFMLLDVDSDNARQLRNQANLCASKADAIRTSIANIGVCILKDVRDELQAAVTPKNPIDLVLKSAQFPGRIGLIVASMLPAIVAGGGHLDMAHQLCFDPHITGRKLRAIASYYDYVGQRIDECESGRLRDASQLSV